MTKLHYYSPGIAGLLIGLIVGYETSASLGLPRFMTYALVPLLTAIDLGLTCQLGVLGFQGLFAGVLPVPIGKTLRGTMCHLIGFLIVLGLLTRVGLSLAGSQFGVFTLISELGAGVVLVWALIGLGCLLLALLLYVFSIPSAVADFPRDD